MTPQKFRRGHRVRIGKLPKFMQHFESDCEAIVVGSYADIHGGKNTGHEYELLLLSTRPKKVAWYPEGVLTLVRAKRENGERILEAYQQKDDD